MQGFGAFAFQALFAGANGTPPIVRYSITLVPETEHFTRFYDSLVFESQNVFGRPTTVPSRNKKDRVYLDAKLKDASSMLPERYKFQSNGEKSVFQDQKK